MCEGIYIVEMWLKWNGSQLMDFPRVAFRKITFRTLTSVWNMPLFHVVRTYAIAYILPNNGNLFILCHCIYCVNV